MTPRSLFTALFAMLLLAGAGQAQAANCRGRYVRADIWSIHQQASGDGRYLYYVEIYNRTTNPVTLDISFSGFQGVTLGAPLMPGMQLPASGSIPNLLFGFGTNSNISMGTVRRVYDAQTASGPTIRLSNCR